jgi:hypothetical protein
MRNVSTPMRHMMAYCTSDGGSRDGMVVGKVTTHGTNCCSFQATSGLCTRTYRSQREDQRENHQFRFHFAFLEIFVWKVEPAAQVVKAAR